jgi:hypothetical protein
LRMLMHSLVCIPNRAACSAGSHIRMRRGRLQTNVFVLFTLIADFDHSANRSTVVEKSTYADCRRSVYLLRHLKTLAESVGSVFATKILQTQSDTHYCNISDMLYVQSAFRKGIFTCMLMIACLNINCFFAITIKDWTKYAHNF